VRTGAELLGTLVVAGALAAQQAPTAAMNIAQAVQEALRNYPSIRVTQEEMNAAAAGIRLARTAYLPRVSGLVQLNRATRNTFYGMLLPQGAIPGVDGAPADNFGSVWDSAAGALVEWQPFDFGLREANVAAAAAARDRAEAALNRTRYEVSAATADAFLTVVAAEQTAAAARAAVDSWQVLLRSIHALASAELRPGADESRVTAELAATETQLAQAEQAVEVARAALAGFVGREPAQVNLNPGRLMEAAPVAEETALQPAEHPLEREQNAAVAEEQSRLDALGKSYYPQFLVQGLASGRGTGFETGGARRGGLNGLAPTVPNFGIGITVEFSAMDRFALREREAMESANLRAGEAQAETIAVNLRAQFNAATAKLMGARKVAANTPVEVTAAHAAVEQARARYESGLAPVDDLAQAQRLLTAAQIDDALARLNVWRGQLEVTTARGDIQPFLSQAAR